MSSGRRGLLFRSRSSSAVPPPPPPPPPSSAVADGTGDHSGSSLSTTNATDSHKIQEVQQQQYPQARSRMMRRSSLDLKQNQMMSSNVNNPQQQPSSRPRPFFSRRGSFTGGNSGVMGNASTTSKEPQPQPSAQQQQQQQQEPPRRRMFRRDSLGQPRTLPGQSPSDSTAATTSTDSLPATSGGYAGDNGPRRPFRRGSFGPRGDAKPPRPVSRRASIGQEPAPTRSVTRRASMGAADSSGSSGSNMLDSSSSLPALATTHSARSLKSADYDRHNDSLTVFPPNPEAPRRVTRRSSIGPGISAPMNNESIAASSGNNNNAAAPPKKKKGLFRKENFVNPFRRGGAKADAASAESSSKGSAPVVPSVPEQHAKTTASRRGDWQPTQVPPETHQQPHHPKSRRGDYQPSHVPAGLPPPSPATQDDQESSRAPSPNPYDYGPTSPEQQDNYPSTPTHKKQSLHANILHEDEEAFTASPATTKGRAVRFASEPEIHIVDYAGKISADSFPPAAVATNNNTSGEDDDATTSTADSAAMKAAETELKAKLWWNSEEMAHIRQECMELVKDYLEDTEYMDAVTKLFTSYKKSVSEEEVQAALEKVAQNSHIRGLEMHIVPRGGLLCEKHRRIVLTNVASTTVDGLSNTGEGWHVIRKESMKASRACRQYALKMAEHDAIEAIESVISPWDEMAADSVENQKKDVAPRTPTASRGKVGLSSEENEDDIVASTVVPPLYQDDNDDGALNAVNDEKPAVPPLYNDDEDVLSDPVKSSEQQQQGAGEASSQDTAGA